MSPIIYINFIPTEVLELIDLYIDDNEIFLELFEPNIKIQLFNTRNLIYKELFKVEFTGFYKEFNNFIKSINNNWEIVYKKMDKNIPKIIKEAYSELSENKNEDWELIEKPRSKLSPNHILNTIGIIDYPEILYEAMFYNNYKDMYIKLSNCCKKDLEIGDKSWYYLFAMFNDSYVVGDWQVLTDYDFYKYLPLYFARMDNGDKIYEILLSDENIKITLDNQIQEQITYLFIVEKSNEDYIKLTKVFKLIIDKLYEKDFIPYYIEDYKNLKDQDMVDWLTNFYKEREGEDPELII